MGRAGSRNNTRKSSGRNKVLEDLGQPELPLLYEKQGRFVNDSARYTVCEAGTKSGKTLGCASWIVKNAWEQPGTLWWWVAPSYGQALIAFQLMVSGERLSADANERRGGPISRMLEPKSQCKVRRTGLCPEIELLQ